jgi:HK97 family phage major capsid protein
MGAVETLIDQRDDLATRLRSLAVKAERDQHGVFTEQQVTEVENLKAQFLAKTAELDRAKSLNSTRDQVGNLLGGASPIATGLKASMLAARKSTPLGAQITRTLFGVNVETSRDQRKFTDAQGYDHHLTISSAVTPLSTKSGFASVPVVQREGDSGLVFLRPENGARIAPLMSPVPLIDGEYKFYRQTGRDDLAAQFVPEKTAKPSTPFSYEVVKDRARMVAVLSDPLSVQELADVTGLRDDVGNELARRVVRRADWALINGDEDAVGVDEFNGVLNVTGVLAEPFATDALTTLRKALTRLQNLAYAPSAYALNPTDWEAVELLRDLEGRLLYAGSFSEGVVPQLFGIPVVVTDVVPAGQGILADWKAGVIAERGQLEVSWSDGGDLFETNTVRFRAEARVGFNVTAPDAFVIADLTAL